MPVVNLTAEQIIAGLTYVRDGKSLIFLDEKLGQFTYSIATASSTWPGYADIAVGDVTRDFPTAAKGYQLFTQQQAANVRLAMTAWDDLIAPDFTETPDTGATYGEIRFAFTDLTGIAAGVSNGGPFGVLGTYFADIWIHNGMAGETFGKGGAEYRILLHEIGHSLGIKHSFTSPAIPAPYENQTYSVMSYTPHPTSTVARPFTGVDANGNTIFGTRLFNAYATTPMVLDILAVQSLYGAETTTRTGNDVYRFLENATTVSTIYDAGGNDTIDLSNFKRNSIIDLNPGAYSSIGIWYADDQLAYWTKQLPGADWTSAFNRPDLYIWENNLGIAFSTVIENASGGAGRDTLIGNAVANRLNGGAGADMLHGGGGNDIYFIDNAGDTVTEALNAGMDNVHSSVSFTLGDHVERLTLTGTGAIKGTGNGLANSLTGNRAANVLDGKAGIDLMTGGAGNDIYIVDNARDRTVEGAGAGTDRVSSSVSHTLALHVENLVLTGAAAINGTGNALANSITGNGGANVIIGGAGLDQLKGGAGADRFLFDSALSATDNVDGILDFSAAADTIVLDRSVFAAIGANGALSAAAFASGAAAKDASDRIIHDQATGRIFYDSDGAGGAAAILFAKVDPGVVLTAADFFIVA